MAKFIKADIILYLFLVLLGVGGFSLAIIWPQTEGFYAFVASTALAGLGVTIYIWYAKRFKKNLACPGGGEDCNAVVSSKYSKFMGTPLEYMGMIYYTVVVISYISLILMPQLRTGASMPFILLLTAAAFIFSIYLIFVQGFLLKKWCIWCLLSAILSMFIFVASLVSIEFAALFLAQYEHLLVLFKYLGYVLGMGGATSAVFLFLKFLDDFNIDDNETRAIKGVSEMIWLGLALIILSEYARFVVRPQELAGSGEFLTQILALSVVFLSGAALNIIFAPLLSVLPFNENEEEGHPKSPLVSVRKSTLLLGAIALSSWYFAFVINYLPGYRTSSLFYSYLAVLAIAVTVSLIFNRKLN